MREIVEFTKKRIDVLNPEAMAEDLSIACAYYYTASTYYANKEAEYTRECEKLLTQAIEDGKKMTADDRKIYIKGQTSEAKRYMTIAKGLVDSLYIKIEALRTLISKAKEEMRITK